MSLRTSLRTALVPFLLMAGVAGLAQTASTPYDAVNPIIGTDGGGNTFPGATLPFGMVQWSPDTNTDAWYFYKDKQITGFGMTHISGAGCTVYGDYAVLPTSGELTTSPGAGIGPYAVSFDHSKEEAHPGYYAITLANGVRVEITVAERSGIARFIFPEGANARLLVNAGSSANTVQGHDPLPTGNEAYGNQIALKGTDAYTGSVAAGGFCGSESHYKLYVTGQFNKPFKASSCGRTMKSWPTRKARRASTAEPGLTLETSTRSCSKIGISFVSEDGANANLHQEIPGWDFDNVHATAKQIWSEMLGRVAVEGGTAEQRTMFYTGLYHSFLSPNVFSDRGPQLYGLRRQGALACGLAAEGAIRQFLRLGYLSQHRRVAGAVFPSARRT